jgi:hypothetical protein
MYPANAMADLRHRYLKEPFPGGVASARPGVSRDEVPNMPDRTVAATGIYLGGSGDQSRRTDSRRSFDDDLATAVRCRVGGVTDGFG